MLGAWKLFLDGSIQGYTGWLKDPGYYDREALARAGRDADWRGGEYDEAARALAGLFARYHLNGESVEVHANGDMAAEAVVRGLEEAVRPSICPVLPAPLFHFLYQEPKSLRLKSESVDFLILPGQ